MMQRIGAGHTILIIDDDPHLLPSLVAIVEALSDFTVITAMDGQAGLERFYEFNPACVVVDVRMPHINGHQFVKALRGDPAVAGTPIVMLTALAQDIEQFRGLAAGADQYLVKPVKALDLLRAIEEATQRDDTTRRARLRTLAETTDTPG